MPSSLIYLASSAAAVLIAAAGPSFPQSAPNAPAVAEIVARLPQSVGNITFTPDNRIIFSHHPFFEPDIRVAELNESGDGSKPFPNAEWNTPGGDPNAYLDSVLGIRGDENGVIWMLDMGTRSNITPKLVGWNTRENKLERVYPIPAPATDGYSQHNDFVVDHKHGAFYLADEGIARGGDGSKGALVVVDMKTGEARRLLEGHVSTRAEKVLLSIAGRPLMTKGDDGKETPLRIGADGIVADHAYEWLYFGPLSGGWLYRVRIGDLLDRALTELDLGKRVERYARKPNNGGLSIDNAGNIDLTEVETTAIGIIPADTRVYRRFASHPDLSWPDGVSYSPDGYLYVSAAQVDRGAALNGGTARNKPPYLIVRVRPIAPSRIGH